MSSPWGVGQIRMDAEPLYNALYLPGTTGNYASTPDSAANSITGDIDLRAWLRPTTWTQAAYIISKKSLTGPTSWAYAFAVLASGQLYAIRSSDGSSTTEYFSTVATGFVAASRHWIRWTRSASTGQGIFYTSEDGASWVQLGGAVSGASGSIFDSSSSVEIGSIESGATGLFAGHVLKAEIRDGIGGTLVQSLDATAVTKLGTRNPSSVSAGGPWTMNGSAWDWDDA